MSRPTYSIGQRLTERQADRLVWTPDVRVHSCRSCERSLIAAVSRYARPRLDCNPCRAVELRARRQRAESKRSAARAAVRRTLCRLCEEPNAGRAQLARVLLDGVPRAGPPDP